MKFFHNLTASLWRKWMPNIIVQKQLGDVLYSLSLRDHAAWIFYGEKAVKTENIPFSRGEVVWDLGSNIGIHSVAAAQAGCKVFAFDISMVNVLCLRQTAKMNDLDITVIPKPVTATTTYYTPASTGHLEERLRLGGKHKSWDYLEAAERCMVPNFIKMDIEGGEDAFLHSLSFRKWIEFHGIALYMELHDNIDSLPWENMQQIDAEHWILPGWDPYAPIPTKD